MAQGVPSTGQLAGRGKVVCECALRSQQVVSCSWCSVLGISLTIVLPVLLFQVRHREGAVRGSGHSREAELSRQLLRAEGPRVGEMKSSYLQRVKQGPWA